METKNITIALSIDKIVDLYDNDVLDKDEAAEALDSFNKKAFIENLLQETEEVEEIEEEEYEDDEEPELDMDVAGEEKKEKATKQLKEKIKKDLDGVPLPDEVPLDDEEDDEVPLEDDEDEDDILD